MIKTAEKKAVLSTLETQKNDIETKIYLVNFYSIFKELDTILKLNNQLHISIIISLEFDNQIGSFLNFKIRNTQTKFIYNKFKLANPKNNSKKDSIIKKIDMLFNQLNEGFKTTYINKSIEEKKNHEFILSHEELIKIQDFFLSSELKSILNYSILNASLVHSHTTEQIKKI